MSLSNFTENWKKDITEIKILPEDYIPKQLVIGNIYRTSWQLSSRFRFKLISYGDMYCKLQSHFNGNTFDCKITDLKELNKQALYNAIQRIKNYKNDKNTS